MHTLKFDRSGILWFTAQRANRIGRLDPKTGEIKLLTPPTSDSRPYGMAFNSKDTLFVVLFGTNKIASVDPKTLAIQRIPVAGPGVAPPAHHDHQRRHYLVRRFFARLSRAPRCRDRQGDRVAVAERAQIQPYGMSTINDVIWYSESGSTPNTVVALIPRPKNSRAGRSRAVATSCATLP